MIHCLAMTLMRKCTLPLLLSAGFLLAGCSSVLDSDQLENEIASKLEAQVGSRPTIECPEDISADAGTTFVCKLTASDGTTADVNGKMVDDDGNFEVTVG